MGVLEGSGVDVKPEGVTLMVGVRVEETLDGLSVIEDDWERCPQAGAHGGGWKH